MLYVIVGIDSPDGTVKRPALRPAHLQRIADLRDEGRLVLAGPMPAVDASEPGSAGYLGSLIVAEFPNLRAADSWARSDPYMTGGVFATLSVRPFRQVMP